MVRSASSAGPELVCQVVSHISSSQSQKLQAEVRSLERQPIQADSFIWFQALDSSLQRMSHESDTKALKSRKREDYPFFLSYRTRWWAPLYPLRNDPSHHCMVQD